MTARTKESPKQLLSFTSRKCSGKSASIHKTRHHLFIPYRTKSQSSISSPRRSEQECSAVQRSGSVPNLSSINQSPTHQTTVSPSQTRHGTRHGREHGILKNRSPNRSHLDASHLHRLGTSFDETRPTNVRVSPTAMSNVHPSRAERNKVSDTAKRHILARQKKVDNFELQSAKNFKAIKNRR